MAQSSRSDGAPRRTGPGHRLLRAADHHRIDLALAALLALAAGIAVIAAGFAIDPRFHQWNALDVWFESDPPRILESLRSRWSSASINRAELHPLFLIVVAPPVQALRFLFSIELRTAVTLVLGFNAALWTGGMFATFRVIGHGRKVASLFTLLSCSTSAAMFWLFVPETYPFGSVSIVFALLVAAAGRKGLQSPGWDIAAGVLTLGITVTNWVFGLLAALTRRTPSGVVGVAAATLALVTAGLAVQHAVFPDTRFFIGEQDQGNYILSAESGGAGSVAASFFFTSVIAPDIDVVDRPGEREYPIMRTQPETPGSAGGAGVIALVAWIALLGLGTIAAIRVRDLRRIGVVAGGAIAAQLALHVVFGHETFLYALDFVPALLVLASLAAFQARRAAIALTSVLVVAAGINNGRQLHRAGNFFDRAEAYRHRQEAVIDRQPFAPIPAPRTRTLIPDPGRGMLRRAVHELGGRFSPAQFRFTITFWVFDSIANVIATSSDIPAGRIDERPVLDADSTLIGFQTRTPYFESEWRVDGPGRRSLTLLVPAGPTVAMVMRGMGTSAGPLRVVERDGTGVIVNGRWALSCSPEPSAVILGEERRDAWGSGRPEAGRVVSRAGWAWARVELRGPRQYECRLRDRRVDEGIERFLFVLQ